MPSPDGGQPIRIDHASDAIFQAWVEANNLLGMIDDNGISAWSFDDRIRVINGAIRQGRSLKFVGETIPLPVTFEEHSNPKEGIIIELFTGPQPA